MQVFVEVEDQGGPPLTIQGLRVWGSGNQGVSPASPPRLSTVYIIDFNSILENIDDGNGQGRGQGKGRECRKCGRWSGPRQRSDRSGPIEERTASLEPVAPAAEGFTGESLGRAEGDPEERSRTLHRAYPGGAVDVQTLEYSW